MITRLFMQLRDDQRGLALIEFAFAAPILFLLFIGGFQSMDAISAYRKVTTTARTMADLMTQSTSTTVSGVQQNLAASQQVMAPYKASGAVLRITQVKIDPLTGIATVDWSQALNGTGYTKGSTVPLPSALSVKGTYLIYSEITYKYVPSVASTLIGQIPLREALYMSPRNSTSIPCSDCS